MGTQTWPGGPRCCTCCTRRTGSRPRGCRKLHRQDRPEPRWPVSVAVIIAIVLQGLLPASWRCARSGCTTLLFGLEGALLIMLFAANPIRIERMSRPIRTASITLIFLITASNTVSAVSLVHEIVTNHLHRVRAARRDRPLLVRRGDLGHERDRVRALVLGVRPWRAGGQAAGQVAVPRPAVHPDERARADSVRAGARSSSTTCTSRSPTRPRSARPTCCRSPGGPS